MSAVGHGGPRPGAGRLPSARYPFEIARVKTPAVVTDPIEHLLVRHTVRKLFTTPVSPIEFLRSRLDVDDPTGDVARDVFADPGFKGETWAEIRAQVCPDIDPDEVDCPTLSRAAATKALSRAEAEWLAVNREPITFPPKNRSEDEEHE